MLSADIYCRPKLYFVKVDVQACFDTIDQGKLLQILRRLLSEVYTTSLPSIASTLTLFRTCIWCKSTGKSLKQRTKSNGTTSRKQFRKVVTYVLFIVAPILISTRWASTFSATCSWPRKHVAEYHIRRSSRVPAIQKGGNTGTARRAHHREHCQGKQCPSGHNVSLTLRIDWRGILSPGGRYTAGICFVLYSVFFLLWRSRKDVS